MFTSRAEYRILLRQDNADQRLTQKSFEIGLAKKARYNRMKLKYENVGKVEKILSRESIGPEEINPFLDELKLNRVKQKGKISAIVQRPEITISELYESVSKIKILFDSIKNLSIEEIEEAEIQIKYRTYIEKEKEIADKLSRFEDYKIPLTLDYNSIKSITLEAREKLSKQRPETIGQASRISGVNPSDITVLIIYLGK